MASHVFDRLYNAALAEAAEVHRLASQLADVMTFTSVVDCFRLARLLHAAGAEFDAVIGRIAVAQRDASAARRRLAGKPPLPPLYQQIAQFLMGKVKELPW